MKKNNFKKIFVVFSLCVFLLSMFSISSFALNISDASSGYLYKFSGSLIPGPTTSVSTIGVSGYLVNKTTGVMTPFTSLSCGAVTSGAHYYYYLRGVTSGGSIDIVSHDSSFYDVYINYSSNTVSKAEVEAIFDKYWTYTVESISRVPSFFNKVSLALSGGTNSEGATYDGLLGMISKFGNFLVSSPLLLVLCIALPLVSFSVGLIIRIKNRA